MPCPNQLVATTRLLPEWREEFRQYGDVIESRRGMKLPHYKPFGGVEIS
jgi:hypothetical protein